MFNLRKVIASRLDEELRFFRGWMDQPKAVGAVLPTSAVTAQKMASVVEPASGRPVLELGPGTGVVTRALLRRGVPPEKLFSVEYSADFAAQLRREFPRVHVIEGDAFDLDRTLPPEAKAQLFDAVISAVPLLTIPVPRRVAYLEGLLDRVPEGRPVVQITYSLRSPMPPGWGSYQVEHLDFMLRNIPPAQLWLYRRPRRN